MKQRLADYVADFLTAKGITDCFTVVGGGAMHLNDAFGHKKGLNCTYNHHEQACAIAAECYARLNNKMALLCVTTGPGGTNAITGVVGAWLDSIPMFIVSGQVRYDTTARYNEKFTQGYKLRAVGDQEFDIIKSVSCMCKYAVMIEDPKDIRYSLEKAYHLAITGRPGPVWLDIPVNFQGSIIETDELIGYEGSKEQKDDDSLLPAKLSENLINIVFEKIKTAKRPILYAGNGIRISGGYQDFRKAVEKMGIPVCTYWDSIDLIESDHPLYVGRGGNMGDRAGNFAIQNADLILAVGNRLPIRVVGYNWKTWAREAQVIMVDIDPAELRKPTIHVEMPIHADAKDFFGKINLLLEDKDESVFNGTDWLKICQNWKKDYPVVLERHWKQNDEFANPYASFDYISKKIPEGTLTVTSNGTCCVAGHQSWFIKKGSRFFNNNAIASMGYGLPAAVGACIAAGKKTTICLEGDGSIMMNLQELQTVVTNNLPIKIVLINNQGYHSIRQTQNNLFKDRCKIGIGPESKDISFPDYKKIALAFDIPYYSACSNDDMKIAIDKTLEEKSFALCELFVSTTQIFEPKSSTKRLEDGTLVSPPLEDLAPFLPREELMKNLYIKPLE
ncbi:MAG: thiamine pyrophosphate-binding protein [Treponemataceae bacterium]